MYKNIQIKNVRPFKVYNGVIAEYKYDIDIVMVKTCHRLMFTWYSSGWFLNFQFLSFHTKLDIQLYNEERPSTEKKRKIEAKMYGVNVGDKNEQRYSCREQTRWFAVIIDCRTFRSSSFNGDLTTVTDQCN